MTLEEKLGDLLDQLTKLTERVAELEKAKPPVGQKAASVRSVGDPP